MMDFRQMLRDTSDRLKSEMAIIRGVIAKDHRMELNGYLDQLAGMYVETCGVLEWIEYLDGDDDLLISK